MLRVRFDYREKKFQNDNFTEYLFFCSLPCTLRKHVPKIMQVVTARTRSILHIALLSQFKTNLLQLD